MGRARLRRALAAAALTVPLTLTACTPPWERPDGEEQAAGAAPAAAGDSWIVVTKGDPPAEKPAPAAPPPDDADEEPAAPAPVVEAPDPEQVPCVGSVGQGQIQGLTVTSGPTTATVTWYHPGDPDVLSYRLAAVPQRLVAGAQPELSWQNVAPGEGCRTITSTVRGLVRGAPYIFWLDAVRTARLGDGTRAATTARSTVVYVR